MDGTSDNQGLIPAAQKAQKSRRCPVEFFTEEKAGKKSFLNKTVKVEHHLINELVGTPNTKLAENIITTAATSMPNSLDAAQKFNIILQSVVDCAPNDAHEARLTAQATVLYTQGMDFLERARNVLFDEGTFAKHEWHITLMNTATKLLSLHTKTVDALTRYRQKGEQKIVVQHVNVNDGGQAIVGSVLNQGGGGGAKYRSDEVPHGHITNL